MKENAPTSPLEKELEEAIDIFAEALEEDEESGFKNPKSLLVDEILRIAKEKHISIIDAAWEYSDEDTERDTSWFQLHEALHGMDPDTYTRLKENQLLNTPQ